MRAINNQKIYSVAACFLASIIFFSCSKTSSEDSTMKHHGFGPIGEHGERKITNLSQVICGFDAHNGKVVYISIDLKIYVIDLDSETEWKIESDFLKNLAPCNISIWNDNIVFRSIQLTDSEEDWEDRKILLTIYNLKSKKGKIFKETNVFAIPKIHEEYVVWADLRHKKNDNDPGVYKNLEVYLYDMEEDKEYRITYELYESMSPSVYGNYIVWRDDRDQDKKEEIFLYNIETGEEKNITNHNSGQWYPEIWGDGVVWTDLRNGTGDSPGGPYFNTDIYYYNISKNETRKITIDQSDQEGPMIFGKYITWNDFRDGGRQTNGYPFGANVYMYDLETGDEKRVTWSEENDGGGIITEDKIIWYSTRNNEHALYMKELDDI